MKAWELISEAGCWTRLVAARNLQGEPVHEDSADATCWCAIGAIAKCYKTATGQEGAMYKLCRYLQTVLHIPRRGYDMDHDVVARWNDDRKRTQAEVVGTLKHLMI